MREKRTSIQIYEPTKRELVRVIGELQAENGMQRSFDDVILELVNCWRKTHKKDFSKSE
jgi:hypothetical protein